MKPKSASPQFEQEVASRTGAFLQKRYWAVFSRPTGPVSAMQPHIADHLDYVTRLSRQGLLFAAGPFLDEGASTGEGMFLIRADSREAAERIAGADPFCVAGVRDFVMREWICNVGSVTVSLNYADQTFTLT